MYGHDIMSELVSNNFRILLIMSRFGIRLGLGDKSVSEVCRENGVDEATFLSVANIQLAGDDPTEDEWRKLSPLSLISYLHKSHEYFLDFRLPKIRRDLVAILGDSKDDLTRAVIGYFDEYVKEVHRHMKYEEKKVFPYVRALLDGKKDDKYSMSMFSKHHDQVEFRLKEFKQILIKYFPAQSTNELNGVLFDIFNCEHDLKSHNDVENHLFIPVIAFLEKEKKQDK